jgi:hypothetical protein
MSRITFITILVSILSFCSFVQAKEKAPSTYLQGLVTWGDVDGTLSFPYLETGTYPTGGDLEFAYRMNLSSQVILLGFHFDLGVNKEHLIVNDTKLKTHLGFGVGPTVRMNYGLLHSEVGFAFGPRGYLFGYIPNELDDEANGYAMSSWGLNGNAFLRFGVGSFFVGGMFGLEKPFSEPGELKPAISYDDNITTDDIINNDFGEVDTSNIGKVNQVKGRTRTNISALIGFWF